MFITYSLDICIGSYLFIVLHHHVSTVAKKTQSKFWL